MHDSTLLGVDVLCVVLLVQNIYTSARRWLSVAYALAGFVIPIVLSVIPIFVFNIDVDTVGGWISVTSPITAVIGAFIPPSREKRA
jgi:hypothetical protein